MFRYSCRIAFGMLFLFGFSLHAQGFGENMGGNQVTVPIGTTTIGGKTYISMRLQPELAFGKFGVGLDVPLTFSTDGKFRKDEYQGGIGALRVIRYIRYGVKHEDPVYVRIGDITGTSLGYGLIMHNFTNAVSFDKRKIGANIDLNYDLRFGLEAVYSDFNRFAVFGMRPYVRPLKTTDMPILKTTEFGVTYITDRDNDALYNITEVGADVGVSVVETSFLKITPYMEYAAILKNDKLAQYAKDTLNSSYGAGKGFAMGVNFKFNFVADVFTLNAKIERRIYSDNFLPQYFDATYEIGKINGSPKALALVYSQGRQGTYGELFANLIGKIQVIGGMSIPDNLKKTNGAIVHLGMAAPDLIPKVTISGTYDKSNLDKLGDAFKLDQRSIAHMILAYQAYQTGPFVVQAGVDYKWTFVENKNNDGFKAKRYVTPFVGMTLQLPTGSK
ncbi:hypothetical protein JNM05_03430 [bacterium]|nr:hypothetical protein [bacterium]